MDSSVSTVNVDLQHERDNCPFNVKELSVTLYGGAAKFDRKKQLELEIAKRPEFHGVNFLELGREKAFDIATARFVKLQKLIEQLKISSREDISFLEFFAFRFDAVPMGLHYTMFVPTIEAMTSPSQKKEWLPKAINYEMIGTYAQTELGHGTFIRGLETEARYDSKTEEFVLNSPTLTSMKFWPGSLGILSTHCILMAQLYTEDGKCHGPHGFLLQLRSSEDHTPLPGISIGDIGTKYGYFTLDNGFIHLTNVRIPRNNMLMAFSEVSADGKYRRFGSAKLTYGSMVLVRTRICRISAVWLSCAVTIAVRYSIVRRQSKLTAGNQEMQVVDYNTQKLKLFSAIAMSYALKITSERVLEAYERITTEVHQGQEKNLAVLHGLTTGLKAFCSGRAVAGIEQLRHSCGGHGFLDSSGFPAILSAAIPSATYEGDNTVMYLQCARFLIKVLPLAVSNELPAFVTYLSLALQPSPTIDGSLDIPLLVNVLEHCTAKMIADVGQRMQTLVTTSSAGEAWNQMSPRLVQAAEAHSYVYTVRSFAEWINEDKTLSPPTLRALRYLCELHAINGILERLSDFLLFDIFNASNIATLRDRQMELLGLIRPCAIGLVDAFDYPDFVLDSSLGRYDGDVYRSLALSAQKSSLNNTYGQETFNRRVRPWLMEKKAKL